MLTKVEKRQNKFFYVDKMIIFDANIKQNLKAL